jgi:HEAT repeat protein
MLDDKTVTDNRPNIWRLQATFDINGLVQALQDEDFNIRKRATAALYALGAVDAVPALRDALDKETDTEVRASLVTALAHLSAEDSTVAKVATQEVALTPVERMLLQLNSEQPERIIQAARSLGELKDKTAVEPLVIVFRNTAYNGHVRLAAAEALLALESAPAEVTLLGALRSRKWQLRRNAAAILGQLRADWAVVPLGVALHDEVEVVARTARAALKRIGTDEAKQILMDGPKEKEHADRLSTSEALIVTQMPPATETSENPAQPYLESASAETQPARPKGLEHLQKMAEFLKPLPKDDQPASPPSEQEKDGEV